MNHSVMRIGMGLGGFAVLLALLVWPGLAVGVTQPGHLWVPPWQAVGPILRIPSVRSMWELFSVAGVAGAVYLAFKFGGSAASGTAATSAYGSAKWRSPAQLAKSLARWAAKSTTNPAGVVVGVSRFGAKRTVREAWVVRGDSHSIILGAPGAGKSLKIVLPSIGVIGSVGESLIISDPKGELYESSAGLLADTYDYRILRFDLRTPAASLRWNPLSPVAQALADQRTADATRYARDLATILTANQTSGGEHSGFFQQSNTALITALVLAVAGHASEAARHMASAYAWMTQEDDLHAFFDALPANDPARMMYGVIRRSDGETLHNQITSAAVALSLFADPNIAWLTAADTFHPQDVVQGRTAIYLVIPDDSSTYYPLATLFITQLLQSLSAYLTTQELTRLPVPVHFILDEFGNLPQIPDFDKALAVARGRGIRINLALQAFAQLDARYGAELAKTMRNSCNTWVYLSSNDVETARLISDAMGQSTIETTSKGWNGDGGQRHWSQTTQSTGRALLTPDEVLRWPSDEALVLQAHELPARVPVQFWKFWPFPPTDPPQTARATIAMPPLWAPPPAGAGKETPDWELFN